MSGFDWGSIADTELQAQRRLLLLEAFERQRKRALELQAEDEARTAEPDPYAAGADPARYVDQLNVAPATAAEKAQQLYFDMLSNGGAQGSALGSAVFEQLGSMLSAFDRTEPS